MNAATIAQTSLRATALSVALAALVACGSTPQAPAAEPTAAAGAPAYPAPGGAGAYPAPEAQQPSAYPAPLGEAPQAPAPSGAALPGGLDAAPIPAEKAAAALVDLAQRTGAEPAAVTLVSAEAVEWSDGSLGCPKEGVMYPQVITPGYRLVLAVAGAEYAYHGDQSGELFYCERPAS